MKNFKTFLNESQPIIINESYRIGILSQQMDFSRSGGIWFSEKEIDVINFHISMGANKERETNPVYKCRLTFQNPKIYSRFWEGTNGYLSDVDKFKHNRNNLMQNLISQGYDSIIIEEDIWNDTGDKYASSYSKQYVAFNYNQIQIISKKIIKYQDYILDDPTPDYLKDFMKD